MMYIAIEGVIGVGKTTLARLLQPAFQSALVLEVFEENPFLSDFYSDRQRYAFLASTDSGGVRDYAVHEQTALLSPPNDPAALAANVLRLLASDDLRHSLASQGERAVRTFTWHAAGEAFAQLLDA